jgi:hypothetical protein
VGALLPSAMSPACSAFVLSDRTLYSSSRLVGGVEIDGDALDMIRASTCFSVRTVMLDSVDDVDDGEASRAAMAGGSRGLVALRLSCWGEVATRWREGWRGSVAPAQQHCQSIRAASKRRFSRREIMPTTHARMIQADFEGDEAPCSKVES